MNRLTTRVCALIMLGWMGCALLAPLLPLAPNALDLTALFAPPDASHWLGTDDLGRSIAARVIAGARVSCGVGLAVMTLSLVLGVSVGVACGMAGGVGDLLGARVIDIFMAFPGILLAIALAGVLGPGLDNVIVALCCVSWVGFARLARAQTLAVMARDHVLAARTLGSRRGYIVTHHLLVLIAAPLLVEASFVLASAVVAEAGLSFLGLGAQPPLASWGGMIRQATQFMVVAPYMLLGPCLALMSLATSANVLGDRLRDAWQLPR
ncbi:MAG: ABC transporter permease [Gammaproteobacteria bacterium]|nr:ABC transporter permease [Gammaproteobacteria bacterium]